MPDRGVGVSTGVDGDYSITVAPGTKLVYSSIGYNDAEFIVPEGAAEVKHDVVLETESMQLDDVVVIAYGVRKKGTITGSVATVKSETIESTPTAAFDQALQGQVPGLMVLSNSGEPSAAATMTIRGTNSINSGTAPLYILDGVAISASDFNTISPSDIESLTVLRDASSTSIYGARAANGVIVITTKRGRQMERPQINYRMQLGFSDIACGNWDLMNTAERIQYEKEVGLTSGKDYSILSKTDVNWLDAVYSNAAFLQSYELGVSGATDKTNYYVSGSYYDQEGIAVGSDFQRYSMRVNFEQQLAKWLRMGSNTMFNYQGIEQADEGAYTLVTPISAARFMLPYWNPFKADGSLASIGDGSWKGQGENPLEWIENNPRKYKKYKVMSTLFAEITPIKGLTIRSQFAVDFSHITGLSKSFPSYAPNQGDGSASRNTSDGLSLNISNTIGYTFDVEDIHSFNFMLGQEGVTYHYEGFSLTTAGQSNDFLTDISTGTRATSWSSTSAADYALVSFFARGEYNYDSRYFLELAARVDGSSRFGKKGRYAPFGSVGFMWNMKNEGFAQNLPWLTTAQIAFSSGTAGNSSIPNYEHLALVGGGMDYVGNSGVVAIQPGNDTLGWESTWTTNLGFHFGFWNRLNVDLELYDKETSNMLMEVPLSYATSNGFGYKWDNVGRMRNLGAEVSLSAVLVAYRDFLWNFNFNVGYNSNKIVELYNGVKEYEPANTSTKLVVGDKLGQFYINRYAGVNPANGDALWYTKDGELTTDTDVLTGASRSVSYYQYLWDYDSSFEIILKVGFTETSYGGSLGQIFHNYNRGSRLFYPDYVPANWVLNLYQTGDLRYNAFFAQQYTGYAGTPAMTVLMKYFGHRTFISQYQIYHVNMPKVFRLSEQYLIRAEAYCRQGRYSDASADLTTLRKARFSGGNGSISVGEGNWLEQISNERVRELYMEGFRLNDLKRWGKGFTRTRQSYSLGEGSDLEIKAGDYRFVWPIPNHEIESPGTELEQNPGY